MPKAIGQVGVASASVVSRSSRTGPGSFCRVVLSPACGKTASAHSHRRTAHRASENVTVTLPGHTDEDTEAGLEEYQSLLLARVNLKRVFLLIDARRGIGPVDKDVLQLLDKSAVNYQIVLTNTTASGCYAGVDAPDVAALNLDDEPVRRTSITGGRSYGSSMFSAARICLSSRIWSSTSRMVKSGLSPTISA